MASSVKNHIFYHLTHGKPNPELARPEGALDTREVVEQKRAQGPTCWYNALKALREQYGKNPHPSFFQQRVLEKIVSSYRKEIADESQLSLKEESIEEFYKTSTNGQFLTLHCQPSEALLKQAIETTTSIAARLFPHQEDQEILGQFVKLVSDFTTQMDCLDMSEFVAKRHRDRLMDIHLKYLRVFKTDPKEAYAKDCIERTWRPSWDMLKERERLIFLSNLAIRVMAKNAYRLNEATWTPRENIDVLIQELSDHGPLFVSGNFGKEYYEKPPLKLEKKIFEETIWYWPVDSDKSALEGRSSHSIVVIGAAVGGKRGGYVYFVDRAQDGSNPANPEAAQVYVLSYQRFKENIHDLFGERYRATLHRKTFRYALYGSLPFKSN